VLERLGTYVVFLYLIVLIYLYSTHTEAAGVRYAHAENKLLIKHKKSSIKSYTNGIKNYLNAESKKFFKNYNLELVEIGPEHSLNEALFLFSLDPSIEYAEPDYIIHTTDTIPNDTTFSEQWGLHNNGSSGGQTDIDVNAPLIWDTTSGSANTVIAVIDTGINLSHPDLLANLWENPGEIAGNSIDDDNNGYIDDVHGINTVTGSSNPEDDNGHGSHVAGIIAAAGNNGQGVSGVMMTGKLIACKFMNSQGAGNTSDALECLNYIYDLKTRSNLAVNIVASNNSWSTNAFSQALYEAIEAQNQAGIIFVAAAGNDVINLDFIDSYPANMRLANIITVGSIDRTGHLSGFSNYGKFSVHTIAPGTSIVSTYLNNGYQSLSGTSMSAPHVTGLLGLLATLFPNNSAYQNKNLIISSGKTLSELSGKSIGESLLRAADSNGLGASSCHNSVIFKNIWPKRNAISLSLNENLDSEVLNIDCANGAGNFSATVSPANLSLNFLDDGNGSDRAAGDGVYSARFTGSSVGLYSIDFAGHFSQSLEVYDDSSWQSYRASVDSSFSAVSINGSKLDLGDDDVAFILSPFAIPLAYGTDPLYHVYVSSNGSVSLSDYELPSLASTSLPINNVSSLFAPYLSDLDPSAAGLNDGVYYEVIGQAPSRKLVIEWRNVPLYDSNQKVRFQVIFSEDSPELNYLYYDLNVGNPSLNGGQNALIGAQVRDMGFNLADSFLPIADNSSFTLSINQAPLANAGADGAVSIGNALSLDGSLSSDAENQAGLRYSWSRLSGPVQNLENSASQSATVVGQNAGTTVFLLTVSDDGGAYASDSVSVTVSGSSSSGGGGGGGGGGGAQADIPSPINTGTTEDRPKSEPENPEVKSPELHNSDVHVKVLDQVLLFSVESLALSPEENLSFDVEIHDRADFSHLIAKNYDIKATISQTLEIKLENLKPASTYYWRLRVFNGESYSAWVTGDFLSPEKKAAPAAKTKAFGCQSSESSPGFICLLALLAAFLRRRIGA
jgi:serine protease